MVLVTGGTGLVGAHLLLHLIENGETVRALYRSEINLLKTKELFEIYNKSSLFLLINWSKGDLLDIPSLQEAFQDIQYVYHCAALISFDPADEELIRKTNIEGTANMVNLSLANGIKKLAFVSSIAALGDSTQHDAIITEETEWNPEKPHSDYAISKYGAEMEIWRAQQEGLETIVVNPGVILGPGFWEQGSGVLFSTVKKGLAFYTKGNSGFIAVTDVVKALHLLMKSTVSGERYILIAENISFQVVLNSIANTLEIKRPRHHAKPIVMELLWRLDWILSKLLFQKRKLSKATAKSSYSKQLYSNQKIKDVLKINFLDIPTYISTLKVFYR